VADLQVVTLGAAGRASITGLFTDRRDGASQSPYDEANLADHVGDDGAAVAANRETLEGRVGRPIVWMEQVHGTEVAVVTDVPTQQFTGVDALVTDRPEIGLGVLVADCVPVLMADADAGVVAAAHVGRRGLIAGAALRTIEAMTGLGAAPGHTHVWLGPSICGRCYEVPAKMRSDVEAAAPGSATATSAGRPGVDLRAGLRRQLLAAGIGVVRDVGPCTAESKDHYSYRRDGVTGRSAGVIVLASPRAD
jgi:YfiH family protein